MKLASFGTFWTSQSHLLNESANVNFTVKVLESLDFSTESGFLMQMVRIFEKIGPDLVWILILLVWNLNWRHWIQAKILIEFYENFVLKFGTDFWLNLAFWLMTYELLCVLPIQPKPQP